MLYAILILFNAPAAPYLPIPVDIYQVCIFVQHRALELGVTGLSLVYGTKFPSSFVEKEPFPLIVPQTS